MNKTDIFFKKLLDKRAKSEDEARRKVSAEIIEKFAELYAEKGYDMLIQDCAQLLDVNEKWLIRTFGHEFDYFIAPSPATTVFSRQKILGHHKLREKFGYVEVPDLIGPFLEVYNNSWFKNTEEERVGLSRKRIFVNRESFYRFMKKHLVVVNELKKVAIPRDDLKNLSNAKLDKIKYEVFTNFNLGKVSRSGNFSFYETSGLITEEHFNVILEEKLYSGKTIKEGFVGVSVDNYLMTKIYDTQLYRWLGKVEFTKIILTPKGNKAPVVRYLFPFNINKELGLFNPNHKFLEENYVFNIPAHMKECEIIDKFLFYVNFLDNEGLINKDE